MLLTITCTLEMGGDGRTQGPCPDSQAMRAAPTATVARRREATHARQSPSALRTTARFTALTASTAASAGTSVTATAVTTPSWRRLGYPGMQRAHWRHWAQRTANRDRSDCFTKADKRLTARRAERAQATQATHPRNAVCC